MSNIPIDPLDENLFLPEPEDHSTVLPEFGAETPSNNPLEDLTAVRQELRTAPVKEPAERPGIFSRLRNRFGKIKELGQPVSATELSPSPERYQQSASAPGVRDTPSPAASTPVDSGYDQIQNFGFSLLDDPPAAPPLTEDAAENSYPAADTGSFPGLGTTAEHPPLGEMTLAEPDFSDTSTTEENPPENKGQPFAWKTFFDRFLRNEEDSQDPTQYSLSDDQLQNRLSFDSEDAGNNPRGPDLRHQGQHTPPFYEPVPDEASNILPDWLKETGTPNTQPTAGPTPSLNDLSDPLYDLRSSLGSEEDPTLPAIEEDWPSDDDDPMAERLSSFEAADTGFGGLAARLSSDWNQPAHRQPRDEAARSRFPEPNPGPPAEALEDLSNRMQLLAEDERPASVLPATPGYPIHSSPDTEAQVPPQNGPEADDPFSNLTSANQLDVLPSLEDTTALGEMRTTAMEGYDPFQTDTSEEEPDNASILQKIVRWVTDPRHRVKVILGTSILLAAILLVPTSIYLLQRLAFSQPEVQQPASNPPGGIPYPVGLRFPGGWYFQLSSASIKDGQWNPQTAEWLQGAEIRRVISVPWNRQSEAVVRSFEPGDPIELQMSNGDILLYSIQSVGQVSAADTTVLSSSQPSLVVILYQPSASGRWVVISKLK